MKAILEPQEIDLIIEALASKIYDMEYNSDERERYRKLLWYFEDLKAARE